MSEIPRLENGVDSYIEATDCVAAHRPDWRREYEALRDADDVIAPAYRDGDRNRRAFIESVFYTISRL